MIVRAVTQFRAPVYQKSRGAQRIYHPGRQYEVSDDLGDFLVREGLAERAERSTERKVVDAGTVAEAELDQGEWEEGGAATIEDAPEGYVRDPEDPRLLQSEGSSWYLLPNGDKVNGRKNALERLEDLG